MNFVSKFESIFGGIHWLLRKDICFHPHFFSGGGVLGMAVGSSIALDGAMKAALREATLQPLKHQTASPTLGQTARLC